MIKYTNSEEAMEAARGSMVGHEVALSVLAMGEASPDWTEDFKKKIDEAAERLRRHAKAAREKNRNNSLGGSLAGLSTKQRHIAFAVGQGAGHPIH